MFSHNKLNPKTNREYFHSVTVHVRHDVPDWQEKVKHLEVIIIQYNSVSTVVHYCANRLFLYIGNHFWKNQLDMIAAERLKSNSVIY